MHDLNRTLLLVLSCEALSLAGDAALARGAGSALLTAVQQVGFLLGHLFWCVCLQIV